MGKILMLTGGGFHPFQLCSSIAKDFLEQTGIFTVEVTEDRNRLMDLSDYSAVIIYTQGGELSEEQENGLLGHVRNGGGVVGIHSAADSWTTNKGYMEMIGAQFREHGPMADIRVSYSEEADAIVPRVDKSFVIYDEFYMLKRHAKEALTPFMYGWWQERQEVLGYVRKYGKGKVLYTGLGHDERAFNNPQFQELIIKGLVYVTGRMSDATIRLGIVGYGPLYAMGKYHAENINNTPGLITTAICDKDSARLEAARNELGDIPVFTDASEMAESGLVDAAVVAVPPNVHAEVVLPLVERGLHVISEKPFAITTAEVDQMIEAAKRKGVVLSVFHNRHWDSDIVTLRHIMDLGLIGEVYSVECNMMHYGIPYPGWRTHKPISGGLLYDMGVHQFEKAFQIAAYSFEENSQRPKAFVYGNCLKKAWHHVTIEDYWRAYVKFESGLEMQIVQSNLCAAPKPLWVVLGTRGSAVIESWDWEKPAVVNTYVNDRLTRVEYPIIPPCNIPDYFDRLAAKYYRNLADHILMGLPLIITPEWARNPVAAIELSEKAALENRILEAEFVF
ncbi:MAG: ThuA domain-containing protein [Bacillota bacterium]|jgi:scyllo-inositol 2-dehydrogenase (NADP+)